MKKIFLLAAIVFTVAAHAQVTKVRLQASGLTCSMCSNAINKALKSVDFVESVDANIKTSTFEITFKPNAAVDFDKLKSKVEGAGFFVSKFIATIRFNNLEVKPGEPVLVGDKTFTFLNVAKQQLDGDKDIIILDKGFVSAKEYKKNAMAIAEQKGSKIYHATI